MKKKILKSLAVLSLFSLMAIPALADTVYYNGDAVLWNYGRKMKVFSYSQVQTSQYQHSATANTACSGWKEAGVEAYASKFIGNGTAQCFWNCK